MKIANEIKNLIAERTNRSTIIAIDSSKYSNYNSNEKKKIAINNKIDRINLYRNTTVN